MTQAPFASMPPLPQPPVRSRPGLYIGLGVGLAALVLLGLGALAIVFVGAQAFMRFGIRSDLNGYETHILASNLDPKTKDYFSSRLDRMRRATDQKSLGLLRWVEYDEKIEALIKDEAITAAELPQLDRQLRNIEQDLDLPPAPALPPRP